MAVIESLPKSDHQQEQDWVEILPRIPRLLPPKGKRLPSRPHGILWGRSQADNFVVVRLCPVAVRPFCSRRSLLLPLFLLTPVSRRGQNAGHAGGATS